MEHVPATYGALLLGGFLAYGLSGVVVVQCVLYFKLYPRDVHMVKAMVAAVWFLDMLHSALIITSLFDYFITFFGVSSRIEHIPWPIALSVVVTALQTFLVQCYFAQKILRSSNNNWYITGPIVLLALLRLMAACVSTVEMTRLHQYSAFTEKYPGWVFTTGLALSAGVDIIITGWLCYFLWEIRGRMGSTIMIQVVDALTLYTLENGALTCMAAIASLACWLAMPTNLIFLGLHFIMEKLYANSLLASLNTRKELREVRARRRWDRSYPVFTSSDFARPRPLSIFSHQRPPQVHELSPKQHQLEVAIEQRVEQTSAYPLFALRPRDITSHWRSIA
ncbi:hypothetical protein BD779DRAFT_289594 [Infundibulicybe gibba]|nr:hypothetical protein BD779DRAFT_289594 [Infundibulicybe gibba]